MGGETYTEGLINRLRMMTMGCRLETAGGF